MKHFFSANIRGNSFDICINPANFSKAHKVFELYQDGSHFQFLYQDNITGEFFTGEDSKLAHKDLEELYEMIRLQINQLNTEQPEIPEAF